MSHSPVSDPVPLAQKLPRSSVTGAGAAQSAAPPCRWGDAALQLSSTLRRPWLPLHKPSKKHQLEYGTRGHINHHDLVNCTGQDIFWELHKSSPSYFCTCSHSLLKQRCASSCLLLWKHRGSPKQGHCQTAPTAHTSMNQTNNLFSAVVSRVELGKKILRLMFNFYLRKKERN